MKLNITFTFSLFMTLVLSACSNNATSNTTRNATNNATNTSLNKQKTSENGTILAVKSITIKPEQLRPHVGVSIGSGGYRGISGGFDIGNVVRVIQDTSKPKYKQEIVVRKSNGDTVSITQTTREQFKKGDQIKLILLKNGEARVIHAK